MKRLIVYSLLACWAALMLMTGAGASVEGTFAYITYNDGRIDQYRVSPSGAFVPLTANKVKVGALPTRVVTDPAGRFAYVGSEDKKIAQFRIGEDGALNPLSPSQVTIKGPTVDLAVDRSGRALYATRSGASGVLQFRISKDGRLVAMSPALVDTKRHGSRIAIHPSKPFAYVTQRSGSVAQLRIGAGGALSPLNPGEVDIRGVAGDLVFSPDGSHAIVTDERLESILEYEIRENGTLRLLGETRYQMDVDDWYGLTTIFMDPGGHAVFVDSDTARFLYTFDILHNGRINRNDVGPDYRITRDRKLITRQQFIDEADVRMDEAANAVTTSEPKTRARDKENARLDALDSCASKMAIPYSITVGPDGAMYVLTTSGVARYTVNAKGELVDGPWAVTWPDEIARLPEGQAPQAFVTRLTIVKRESPKSK